MEMQPKDPVRALIETAPVIVNVGLDKLAEHFDRLGVRYVQVKWSPPAGGDLHLLKKIRQLKRKEE
jgi:hypothetical protein